jgi:hypothetical protein
MAFSPVIVLPIDVPPEESEVVHHVHIPEESCVPETELIVGNCHLHADIGRLKLAKDGTIVK